MLLFYFHGFAQNTITEGAALLFKNVKTKLPVADKNSIYKKINFSLSKDKKQFAAVGEDAEYPFVAFVYPTDLNKDGKEEIFIVFGNSYTSGHTGSSVVMYIKDKSGSFQPNLGFPGVTPDAMPTKNLGYPDLMIGGPGFEWPVWRWNGKEYNFYKKIKEKDLLKMKAISIEDLSKTYASSIK